MYSVVSSAKVWQSFRAISLLIHRRYIECLRCFGCMTPMGMWSSNALIGHSAWSNSGKLDGEKAVGVALESSIEDITFMLRAGDVSPSTWIDTWMEARDNHAPMCSLSGRTMPVDTLNR
jgi:hypothetical protein